MKKLILLFLCIALMLTLCACGDDEPVAGPKGDKGDTGEQGPQGEKGDTGGQGPRGEKGDAGENGNDGVGILKTEIIDGYLWITYTNAPDTPVNLGKVVESGADADEGTPGLAYYPLPDGTWGVMAGTTLYLQEIEIPASYQGKAVTKILPEAFKGSYNLAEITIPDSITSIGDSAFYGCSSLTSVTIPNSVISIGGNSFHNCSSLASATIPSGVTSVGNYAFSGCSTLAQINFNAISMNDLSFDSSLFNGSGTNGEGIKVVIGENVTKIPAYAFAGCAVLTSVIIPDSVTSIGDYAFFGCSSFTSLDIGSSVSTIGDSAFSGCTGLTQINFNATAMNDLSYGNNVFYNAGKNGNGIKLVIGKNVTKIPAYLFYPASAYASPKLTGVEFEDGSVCKSIGDYAFYGCSDLTSITIPNSVAEISNYAFHGCSSLTSLAIGGGVTSIGNYAFYECTVLTQINFNATAMNDLSDYNYVFGYSGQSGEGIKLVMGKNVTKIPAYLFYPTSMTHTSPKLTSVEFEDGSVCESIGEYAFYDCSRLTSITIPDSVTEICAYAFGDCNNLEAVTIGSGVTSIGNYAFCYCIGLTSVTIPDSVTEIGGSAFWGCYKLVEVINKSSLDITAGSSDNGYAGYYALVVHNGDSKIVSKDDYLFITSSDGTNYLFGYAGNETALNLPNDYNGQNYKISNYAFYENSLTSVTIPNGVTEIGAYAFYDCDNLEAVNIGSGVTSIGDGAFLSCIDLKIVNIGSGVTSIGDYAFVWCSRLTSVNVSDDNVVYKSIDGNLYTKDGKTLIKYATGKNATHFDIPTGVTTIGEYAFDYCPGLTSVTVPDGITAIGVCAFYECYDLTSVTIGRGVAEIGDWAFYGCSRPTINYRGGEMEWNAISKGEDWDYGLGSYTIIYNYTGE